MTKVVNTGPGKIAVIGNTSASPIILLYNFSSNGDAPKKEHSAMIAWIGISAKLASLSKSINLRIDIEGFADSSGQSQSNLSLAKRRAESVKKTVLSYGAPATSLKLHPRGSNPAQIPSKATPFKNLVQAQKITAKGGNELDRSVAIFVMKFASIKDLKPDFSKTGWDSIIQQAYDKALWSVIDANLLEIAKGIFPNPSVKGIPIPITGAPPMTTQEKVKAAIRKKTIDIIMEWAKRKGHNITREKVEKEIDSRNYDISKR